VTASCRPVPALVFLKTIPAKSTFASVLMPTILPFLRNDSIHRPECRAIIDFFIGLYFVPLVDVSRTSNRRPV
jgi:hypothetical protein